MKRFIIIIIAFVLTGQILANPVSKGAAIKTAYNFIKKEMSVEPNAIDIVYSPKLQHFVHNAFYVFNVGDSAFVIVAGDDVAIPILAYSFENTFGEYIPSNVQWYLDELANEIDYALMHGYTATERDMESSSSNQLQNTLPTSVNPLLSTTWNQGTLYNEMCPSAPNGSGRGNHVWAGCVATAMAQIIKYWGYPTNPRGWHEYNSPYGTLSVDFNDVSYNYSIMPNALTNSSPNASKQEVRKLLYHCGVALDMIYGTSGSAAYDINARSSLINYFKYSPAISCATRSSYTDSDWKDMLKNELANGRPFLYSGNAGNGQSGHAFVCDGYNSSGYFHFNFGWGGMSDGNYAISAIVPVSGHNYSNNQIAVIGIMPAPDSRTYIAQKEGISSYFVSDTVEVFDVVTTNSGLYGYGTPHNHTIVFKPSDTTQTLVLEPILENIRNIVVNAGHEDSSIINVGLTSVQIAADKYYSTNFSIIDIDTLFYWTRYGFKIYIDNGCRKVTGLSASLSDDSIFLSWHENGTGGSWQVEYGPAGFEMGQGTRLEVADTMAVITNILFDQEYDFYVRSICDINTYGTWSDKLTLQYEAPYWIDRVTSVPDGFVVDTNGNIEISSVEGLVWLISYVNGLNGQQAQSLSGKTVSLAANIDLYPYKWTAINEFAGIFEGNNHIINHLYVSENANNQGLFGSITSQNAQIRNLHILNGKIAGRWNVGGLSGKFYGSMTNCTSSAIIEGQLFVGGLAGYALFANADNCHSFDSIFSTGGNCGGLFGDFNGYISNCHSSSFIKGNINNGTGTGGIVGKISGNCHIENSYYIGNIIGRNYVGGIVGDALYSNSNSTVRNCYADCDISTLSNTTNNHVGSLVGRVNDQASNTVFNHCYISDTTHQIVGLGDVEVVDTVAFFSHNGANNTLENMIQIGDSICTDLLAALDMYVLRSNDTTLMTWMLDTNGYPVHRSYNVPCPSVSNIKMDSVSNTGAVISWNGDGVGSWQVEYGELGGAPGTVVTTTVTSPRITLANLISGSTHQIKVRSLCENGSHSQWSLFSFLYCNEIINIDNVESCDRYPWHGRVFTSSTVVTDTLTAYNGCDSVTTLNLTIKQSSLNESHIAECDGFIWRDGETYTSSCILSDTLAGINGCDSIEVVHLTINRPTHMAVTDTVCDEYVWNGYTYAETGTYLFQHSDFNNCMQTDTLHLTVNHNSYGTEIISTCNSFNWHGRHFTASTDTATYLCGNSAGCDSTTTLHLTINNCSHSTVSACDHYYWNGIDYSNSGIYTYGEDTLELTILSSTIKDTIVNACDSYYWLGTEYTEDVDSTYTGFTNSVGCDSSFRLVLSINHSSTAFDTAVVSILDIPYTYNGYIITEGGDYSYTFTADNGCDSLVRLHVDIDSTQLQGFSCWNDVVTSQPDGYQIGDDGNIYIYTNEGLAWLISVCNNLNGATRPLGWNNKTIYLMADVDMSGHNWTPLSQINKFDGGNHTIQGLVIYDTVSSFHMNNGFVKSVYSGDTVTNTLFKDCLIFCGNAHYTGCIAGTCNGTISNCGVSGTVVSSGSDIGGLTGALYSGEIVNCYSVVDITGNNYVGGAIGSAGNSSYFQNKIINCYSSSSVTSNYPYYNPYAGVFSGYANTYNNTEYMAYWLQRDTLFNGCGNNVAGFHPFYGEDTDWRLGETMVVAGQEVTTLVDALNAWVDANNADGKFLRWATDTALSNNGFPIFESERFTLTVQSNDTNMGVALGSGTYGVNDSVTLLATPYNCHHFTSWSDGITENPRLIAVTRDTVITAIFFEDNPVVGILADTSCDNYFWKGANYTSSGSFTFDTITTTGCDSTTVLNLTIFNSSFGTDTVTACNSHIWIDGNTYSESTEAPSWHLSNVYGCDSIVTLDLTINHDVSFTETITVCDSLLWHGETYYTSTTSPSDTLTNTLGCDSVVFLNLTVNHGSSSTETIVACDSIVWHGTKYTSSAQPEYEVPGGNMEGCDSTVHLNLTIHPSSSSQYSTISGCDSIYLWDQSLTHDTVISHIWTNANIYGCDSIENIILNISHTTHTASTVGICDIYYWHGQTYTETPDTLPVFSQTDWIGCTSTDTLYLTIHHSSSSTEIIEACDSVIWHDMFFTFSTNVPTYVISGGNAQGCDSTVHLDLTIYRSATSSIYVTENGFEYQWNDTTFTQSGTYTWTGTTEHGCDSVVTLHLTLLGVGIEEYGDIKPNVIVYPSPTNGLAFIKSPSLIKEVAVFNLNGVLVQHPADAKTIDLTDLPAGIYLVKITTQQKTAVVRVIKE